MIDIFISLVSNYFAKKKKQELQNKNKHSFSRSRFQLQIYFMIKDYMPNSENFIN